MNIAGPFVIVVLVVTVLIDIECLFIYFYSYFTCISLTSIGLFISDTILMKMLIRMIDNEYRSMCYHVVFNHYCTSSSNSSSISMISSNPLSPSGTSSLIYFSLYKALVYGFTFLQSLSDLSK